MSGPTPRLSTMSDERFDAEVSAFLAWHSTELAGAPSLGEMTARVRGRVGAAPRTLLGVDARLFAWLGVAAALAILAIAAYVLSQPPRPIIGNGPILIAGVAYDPVDGTTAAGCRLCGASVPTWSADGSSYAVASGRQILVVDTATEATRAVVPCSGCDPMFGSFDLSSDGSRLAFVEQGDLVVADVATGARTVLRRTGGGIVPRSPSFSPDGSQVAFVTAGIYIAPTDGSAAPTSVLDDPGILSVAWSPDGLKLALETDPEIPSSGSGAGGGSGDPFTFQSWLLDLASGQRRLLWERHGCCVGAPAGQAWSPDGTKLVIDSIPNPNVWIVDATTGEARSLTTAVGAIPAWQPVVLARAPASTPTPTPSDPAAAIDACGAMSVTAPTEPAEPPAAWRYEGAPDGVVIASSVTGPDGDTPRLWVGGRDGSTFRAFADVHVPDGMEVAVAPESITADGDAVVVSVSVVVPATPRADCQGLWRISTSDGAAERLTSGGPSRYARIHDASSDGRTIVYTLADQSGDGTVTELRIRDATGDRSLGEAPCGTEEQPTSVMRDPDGSRIAFLCVYSTTTGSNAIVVVDPLTGERRSFLVPGGLDDPAAIAWPSGPPADGRILLLSYAHLDDVSAVVVDAIDPGTGATTRIGSWPSLNPGDGSVPAIEMDQPFSPDGRRFIVRNGPEPDDVGAMPTDYVIDLVTGSIRPLRLDDPVAEAIAWTTDGAVVMTSGSSGYAGRVRYDPATGATTHLGTFDGPAIWRVP